MNEIPTEEWAALPFVILMWVVFFWLFGPYMWRATKAWWKDRPWNPESKYYEERE